MQTETQNSPAWGLTATNELSLSALAYEGLQRPGVPLARGEPLNPSVRGLLPKRHPQLRVRRKRAGPAAGAARTGLGAAPERGRRGEVT